MKKFITITILFNVFLNVYAQEGSKNYGKAINGGPMQNNSTNGTNNFTWRSSDVTVVKNYSEIKGTPYVFETFMLGKILGDNEDLMMRYNAVTDEVEIQKTENNNVTLLKDNQFSAILMNFGKYKLRLLNYKTHKNEGVYGYLVEVFNANDFSLLRRDKIILEAEKVAKTSFEPNYPAKFVKAKNEFYIEKKDKSVLPMPKNKKELEAIFPNQKEAIEAFFKNNNYSFKEEQDLIEISKFIATL